MKHSKKIALFFSMIPGAGHMYLGLTRQGIQLMILFFFTFSASAYIHLEILATLLPVIWFYSIFDARSKVISEEPLVDSDLGIFSNVISNGGLIEKNTAFKYIGYGFVLIGIAALINNLGFPLIEEYFGYPVTRFIKAAFDSSILILIGCLLLRSKHNLYLKKGDKDLCKGAE